MFQEIKWWFMGIGDVWIIPCIIITVVFLAELYILAKKYIPLWAKNGRFYLTILKNNEIKAFSIAGKRVAYFGNLFSEGLRVNHQTGKIESGDDVELKNSILWNSFGAVFMGMGAEIEKIISLWNTHEFQIKKAETQEGAEIDVTIRFVTKTIDVKSTMNYEDIQGSIAKRMKPEFLKFFRKNELKKIVGSKKKADEKKEEPLQINLLINDEEMKKVLGLEMIFGQELVDLAVIDLEICDPAVRKTLISQEMQDEINAKITEEANGVARVKKIEAESAAETKIIAAKADLEAAKVEADKVRTLNDVENERLAKVTKTLGKDGATKLESSKALASFKGNVLSFGSAPSFMVNEEREEKKKKQ